MPFLKSSFESQVNKQIADHFESHRTFSTMQSGFRAGRGCTSAMLKVLNNIITTIAKNSNVQPSSSTWPRLSALSITVFLSADSTALVSLMTASPGLLTTSPIEFSVSNWRACCPDLWQSLWACHRVQFSGRLFSLYINQLCCSCCWWFSDPPLRRRHHSVYIWPFVGHCANKPPNELQCHTTLAFKSSKTKCMLFNRLLPAPARLASLLWTVLT